MAEFATEIETDAELSVGSGSGSGSGSGTGTGQTKTILCEDPLVYTIDDYLSHDDCDHFIAVSDERLKQAFVSDTKTGRLSPGRTGLNYWLRHGHDSVTSRVGDTISKQVGYPIENAEAYQVVAYDETQKYDSHYDAYSKNESEKCRRCLKYGGQRMITALVYLSDVEEGGCTRFDKLDINVSPKKGKLLVFHNTLPGTNTVHPLSLHAGCPVIKGYKYAFNLWFREISMKKVYDFPFLAEIDASNAARAALIKASSPQLPPSPPVEEDGVGVKCVDGSTIDINSSGTDVDVAVVSADPLVVHFGGALTSNECKYILSKCVNGREQARGRTSFWVNLSDSDMAPIGGKIAKMIGLDSVDHLENINVLSYPVGCDHGCHFDAFDMSTERGRKFAGARGQRLYTIACLLDEAAPSGADGGSFKFRELGKEVKMARGDFCVYKNFVDGDDGTSYKRDDRLEYALDPVRVSAKHYFYVFVRENSRSGVAMRDSELLKVGARMEELKESHTTVVQENMVSNAALKARMDRLGAAGTVASTQAVPRPPTVPAVAPVDEVNTENYYTTLESFYDTYKTRGELVPYRKMGFKRSNSPLDMESVAKFHDIRQNNAMLNGVHTLLSEEVMSATYVPGELAQVANGVFSGEAKKIIRDYYHNSIDNDKFQFGDRQSQRWKAYDDFMSRLLQFEALPLIERTTN